MAEALPPGDPGSRAGGDLPLRVVSAVALAPLALIAAYVGGWVFFLFWLIAALGVLWEWNSLVGHQAERRITTLGAFALIVAALATTYTWAGSGVLVVLAGAGLAAALGPAERGAWSGVGIVYAAAIVLPALLLRADPAYGFAAIVLLFAVVWATDIVAYFAGRLIGGPKLCAPISPKKTWSGAIVGTAGATLAGVLVAWGNRIDNLGAIALLGCGLAVLSQAGDLFESAVKRRFGAKDAGKLIPGHGGLMDRLDGFVAAALTAAVVGILRGGIEAPARGLLIW